MRSFFKIFFASLLALFVFCVIGVLIVIAIANSASQKPEVKDKSVLVLDLKQHFNERMQQSPMSIFSGKESTPGLYDVIRLIRHAKTDDKISGIYIIAEGNDNGYATSNELRNALLDFKTSKKFIIAHSDRLTQKAYFVANSADKVYINPSGDIDWSGFNVDIPFLKGTLDKLDIKAQVFYAGKFKSATEPFRFQKMSPENKLQTTVWLSNLYSYFLTQTAEARHMDTATLHNLANNGTIQTPQDAVQHKLIDGVKYDDEIRDEIKQQLKLGKNDKINYIGIGKYADAADYQQSGSNRIALVYAEGDIVDGPGTNENIGGENFRKIIRKARMDKGIKAIVLRINSGGGSALASENIWRELELAKKDKPVVVSFGDVAASGGYYIASAADSIFSNPNTITGSIGVFSLVPDAEGFFNNKLGITFDGVKTATYADAGAIYRPLSEAEKRFMQNSVDRIYMQFKQRVAQGRKKEVAYIDSIAQGRVWSGQDAIKIGLVDKLGSLQNAIDCAARMAKVSDYRLREYPETESLINRILNQPSGDPAAKIKEQIGAEQYQLFQQVVRLKQMCNSVQARMPFEFFIH